MGTWEAGGERYADCPKDRAGQRLREIRSAFSFVPCAREPRLAFELGVGRTLALTSQLQHVASRNVGTMSEGVSHPAGLKRALAVPSQVQAPGV